ncbi:putative short-chain dehydrogenase [Diplogelasinospora grovesii]|uniref:Short-chain dehydrogenase n=1 Tax=Diplogelasinospora grovesii TaxID=303347 RepID=A0AAN6NE77_9PEZI|nr:putative short-chain dehydrogenase [Diplogelasinospora grovesii]
MSSRYFESHKFENLRGPGDARPTALQIIQDENRSNDLTGKVVIITGTSSGIGITTAQAMATTGATIYCTARDLGKASSALGSLLDSPKVHLLQMDLTSLSSVKAFADEIKRRETRVNILINNAGVMFIPTHTKTADGFEMHIGVNHLAHFYLFHQLKDLLLAGSTPDFHSRVVNVSSSGHRACPAQLDDINLTKGDYSPLTAYGSSKTANIWMANQIERVYGSKGLHGYSLMPGGIRTGLQKHMEEQMAKFMESSELVRNWMKSPEQGAATNVFAAVARDLEAKGGVYLENCQVAPRVTEGLGEMGDSSMLEYGHAEWAYDQEGEARLWKLSLDMVGLRED